MNQQLKIIKWNVYEAKVPFLEKPGYKIRPVIVIAKIGIAAYIIPLTTNTKNTTKYDITSNINNKTGLIKIGNLQRIAIKNILKPIFAKKSGKIIKIKKQEQKLIILKVNLFFNQK